MLEEAEDETVPLLERVKFLSIFTSNLDEFYMIRVGSLGDVAALGGHGVDNKSGLTAKAVSYTHLMPSSDVYVIAGEKRYMVPAVREFVQALRRPRPARGIQ